VIAKLRKMFGGSIRAIVIHVVAVGAFVAGICSVAAHALPTKYAVIISAIGAGILAVDRVAIAIEKHVTPPAK